MERVIWADIAYPIDYVPTGARAVKRAHVLESVPVTVHEARADDLPLVAEAEISYRQGGGPLARREFRSFRKGLLERATGFNGEPIRPEALETAAGGPGQAWSHAASLYPFAKTLPYLTPGNAPTRPGDLSIRREVYNGRERALAHAHAQAARTIVDGDAVWVPSRTLCWAMTAQGKRIDIKPVRTSQPGRLFHDLESARRFADWVGGQREYHHYRAQVVVSGGIVAHEPGLLPRPSVSGMALRDLDEVAAMDHGAGFPRLPVAALEAWCGFRRAHDALRSGDKAGAGEAYAALANLVEALPPLRMGVEEYRLAVNRMQVHLPVSVRYHESYLAALLPPPVADEADEAALGMVA